MRIKLMVIGVVGLIALSAGVPTMLPGGGEPEQPAYNTASLSVEVLPGQNLVVATLVLDPAAPVIEVSLGSDLVSLEFVQAGTDGIWIAEAPLLEHTDCYPVDARVTLATLQASAVTTVGKVKKAKKVKLDKAKGAAKAQKLEKSKRTSTTISPAYGATVLELSSESCVVRNCPEIMN